MVTWFGADHSELRGPQEPCIFLEGEGSTTKRLNHGCMSPPPKKKHTQGLNDYCWYKHLHVLKKNTHSKKSLTMFSFYYLSFPPHAWEASWNLEPCYAAMPWRAEAIAMMIHLEAMGQPPLQRLQADWWNGRKQHLATLKLESKFHSSTFFFWGGKGRGGLVSCFEVAKIHLETWRFPKSTFTWKLHQKNLVAMKESNPIPNEHQQLVFPPILDMTFRNRKNTFLEAILSQWWHRINRQKCLSSILFVAVFDNWIFTPCSWLWVKIVQVMFDGPFSQLESIAILHVALSKVIRLGRPAVHESQEAQPTIFQDLKENCKQTK